MDIVAGVSERAPDYPVRDGFERARRLQEWGSRDPVDTSPLPSMSRFELVRTGSAKMAVATGPVVDGLDVLGYVRDRGRLPVT